MAFLSKTKVWTKVADRLCSNFPGDSALVHFWERALVVQQQAPCVASAWQACFHYNDGSNLEEILVPEIVRESSLAETRFGFLPFY